MQIFGRCTNSAYRPLKACLLVVLLTESEVLCAATAKMSTFQRYDAIYFRSTSRVRHHLVTLGLLQDAEISDNWASTMEGRVVYDAAVSPNKLSPQRDLHQDVRRDERFDAACRQFHLTYSADSFRARIGQQKIDWVDSIFPQSSDFMTPMDLRRGGFGEPSDLIVPTQAVTLSHSFPLQSQLEWVVAAPKTSKLPAGPNGYGFYESLGEELPNQALTVETQPIPDSHEQMEGGLRFQLSVPSIDLSLFAYRGHNRLPNLEIQTFVDGSHSRLELQYAPLTTYGGALSATASNSTVVRFFALLEPLRQPSLRLKLPSSRTVSSDWTRRYRVGLGLDQVLLDRVKFYSEWNYTKTTPVQSGDLQEINMVSDKFEQNERPNHGFNYRISYEYDDQTKIVWDGLYTGPERSYIVAPMVSHKIYDDLELSGGIRFVKSFSDRSQLDVLRNSSQYIASIERKLTLGSVNK
ncbi:MAG: hypothetical protein NTV34_19245 [Proteobacteria bacterium]|nr:hypothetical protein [Pseudomonadota bacterium]